jgi:DUF1365 family protein
VESALYAGWVRHRREAPAVHEFRYRLCLLYLDLSELDRVFARRWLWSVERPNLAAFFRRDQWGDPTRPLDACIRELVEERTGRRPSGPIRLLTHLRYFGYVFNPASFLYCFDPEGRRVEAIVADVSNLPWRERHAYVLVPEPGAPLRFETPKAFHVSPFMGMQMRYRWAFTTPGERLRVAIANHEADRRIFHASLSLVRRPLDGRNLARVLVTHPFHTAKVTAAIYWEALRLRRKRVPQHPHPGRAVLPGKEPIGP